MKVLFIVEDLNVFGGTERVAVNLSNALNELGYDITIASLSNRNNTKSPPPFHLSPNIKTISYAFLYPTKKKGLIYKILEPLRLSLSFGKYDVIIDHSYSAILAPRCANKIKYIKLFHEDIKHAVNPQRCKYVYMIIILCAKELSSWQKLHNNIKVIPNFVSQIPIDSSSLDNKIVLSVGRMDKGDQKGFLRLLDIWNLVRQNKNSSDWKLIIIGDGILKQDIESKIKDLKLQDSIILKPFTKEIEKEYLKSSIYVMSSFFEGFPMVLLEAKSFGLPAIAFDIATGPSDIIEHNKSGYLIENNNNQDFANKILDLMQDENKRKAFGKNAKEIIRNKFSKEAILPLWEEVLK